MAQNDLIASVILAKLVVLTLAVVLSHLTYRSYRTSGREEIRALTYGFGSIAVGILVGGGLYQAAGYDILVALLVEALFTALGLGFIVYSLYGFE